MNNEATKHLTAAFAWLDKIPVSGQAVDFMAMARQELRVLQAVLQKEGATDGESNSK